MCCVTSVPSPSHLIKICMPDRNGYLAKSRCCQIILSAVRLLCYIKALNFYSNSKAIYFSSLVLELCTRSRALLCRELFELASRRKDNQATSFLISQARHQSKESVFFRAFAELLVRVYPCPNLLALFQELHFQLSRTAQQVTLSVHPSVSQ